MFLFGQHKPPTARRSTLPFRNKSAGIPEGRVSSRCDSVSTLRVRQGSKIEQAEDSTDSSSSVWSDEAVVRRCKDPENTATSDHNVYSASDYRRGSTGGFARSKPVRGLHLYKPLDKEQICHKQQFHFEAARDVHKNPFISRRKSSISTRTSSHRQRTLRCNEITQAHCRINKNDGHANLHSNDDVRRHGLSRSLSNKYSTSVHDSIQKNPLKAEFAITEDIPNFDAGKYYANTNSNIGKGRKIPLGSKLEKARRHSVSAAPFNKTLNSLEIRAAHKNSHPNVDCHGDYAKNTFTQFRTKSLRNVTKKEIIGSSSPLLPDKTHQKSRRHSVSAAPFNKTLNSLEIRAAHKNSHPNVDCHGDSAKNTFTQFRAKALRNVTKKEIIGSSSPLLPDKTHQLLQEEEAVATHTPTFSHGPNSYAPKVQAEMLLQSPLKNMQPFNEHRNKGGKKAEKIMRLPLLNAEWQPEKAKISNSLIEQGDPAHNRHEALMRRSKAGKSCNSSDSSSSNSAQEKQRISLSRKQNTQRVISKRIHMRKLPADCISQHPLLSAGDIGYTNISSDIKTQIAIASENSAQLRIRTKSWPSEDAGHSRVQEKDLQSSIAEFGKKCLQIEESRTHTVPNRRQTISKREKVQRNSPRSRESEILPSKVYEPKLAKYHTVQVKSEELKQIPKRCCSPSCTSPITSRTSPPPEKPQHSKMALEAGTESSMVEEGEVKYEYRNSRYYDDQFDWLEHSRYSINGQKQNSRLLSNVQINALYDIRTPYDPYKDKEFIMEYEAEMSQVEFSRKNPLNSNPTHLSGLQKSSMNLKHMMRESILLLRSRPSTTALHSSVSKGHMQMGLPSCISFPPDLLQIARSIPGNLACCDCGIKHEFDDAQILWASITYGIMLCKRCAFEHTSNNPPGEVIKGLVSEDWNFSEIMHILEGGNDKFLRYMPSPEVSYQNSNLQLYHDNSVVLAAYEKELSERVSQAFGQCGACYL